MSLPLATGGVLLELAVRVADYQQRAGNSKGGRNDHSNAYRQVRRKRGKRRSRACYIKHSRSTREGQSYLQKSAVPYSYQRRFLDPPTTVAYTGQLSLSWFARYRRRLNTLKQNKH